jgi:dolichol-phosphate mannosyltransferase
MEKNLTFSIIVPCFNEEKNIFKVFDEIKKNCIKIKDKYDVIFVDDGSKDKTWEKIIKLKKKFKNIIGIKLSKNFNKDSAINCGLSYFKKKNFYIVADCDLQHPLNTIPKMIDLYKNKKYEIITTHRIKIQESLIRELFSSIFYYLIGFSSNFEIIKKTTDFLLLSNKVNEQYLSFDQKYTSFRLAISSLGFKKTSIPIKINPRNKGVSKYSFLSLLSLAIKNIWSFSLLPIQFITFLGLIIFFSCIIFIFYSIFADLHFFDTSTILLLMNIILLSVILMAFGVLGIYIKILTNNQTKKDYIIENTIK